jgi:2-polyprenyl-6-methoxyphenol hydroxylase-like FAD-dependent oxidoreductase
LLHPDEPPPRPSGLLAVRGVALDVIEQLGNMSGAQYFGRGLEAGVVRAGDREVYWYLSVRAEQFAPPRDALTVATRCAAQFHEQFRAIVAATRTEDLRLDELFDRSPIDHWGRGPVTLLGDAAHPMLPHAGQGAAQAIEDAVTLGALLHEVSDTTALHAALRRYEHLRTTRTRKIVEAARRNARFGSLTSPVQCWLRDQVIPFIPQSAILKSLVAFGKPPGITSMPSR